MGSELHAGSLAMHWFLVLNFKTFPKYTSMNLSWYFPGTLMDLGIQIPQKINLLSRVLLQTLSYPPRAQSRAVPLGSRTVPTAHGRSEPSLLARQQSPQHLHLRYLHSSGAKPWGRWQTQGQNERCMERHQAETRMVSISLTKMLTERQWLATKPGHFAHC